MYVETSVHPAFHLASGKALRPVGMTQANEGAHGADGRHRGMWRLYISVKVRGAFLHLATFLIKNKSIKKENNRPQSLF